MSIKVLVADDSITIQKVIGIIFGGDEYSLTIVDNGKSAVEKAHEINPDILLIDALMPGMSGYEVSEAVRSTPALAAKPILILTGSFEPFDEDKAKKCGADDFIAKPFESQQIITKVKELLELGKTRARSAQTFQAATPAEMFPDTVVEESGPCLDTPSPTIDQQPTSPTNIWSAFTPEAESREEPVVPPAVPVPSETAFEPDVFAIVNEENDAHAVNSLETVHVSPQQTDAQWEPVEEHMFEFVEETLVTPPLQDFSEQPIPVEEAEFGDVTFANEATRPTEPVFAGFSDQAPIFEEPAAPFAPLSDPVPPFTASVDSSSVETVPAATTPVLSEEQLKVAISSASKEVIERIVWEVVPDLAETLIREAIRKIKEGA
ncbi:MAG: response regulator [Desulfuromonadaceae bacterium]|nr:response regulator [Desulfuromonadaceae bacterium]